mmetsp:Transcript_114947/g.199244  ORF Transcript_114947/g.199244 Transcript_114947/m.199244 type:complete len:268 (+) Transcript_114947:128-931(+)
MTTVTLPSLVVGPFKYVAQEYVSLESAWTHEVPPTISFKVTAVLAIISFAVAMSSIRDPTAEDTKAYLRTKPRELLWHDNCNMVMMPLLAFSALLGTFGFLPQPMVGNLLALYIAFDGLWIFWWPRSVPSKPRLILSHHCVTFMLACGSSFVFPEFAYMCCWSTCVEFNTFFLILARLPSVEGTRVGLVAMVLFWATAIPIRIVLHPWLVRHILYASFGRVNVLERFAYALCQVGLVVFNIYFVYLRVRLRMYLMPFLKNLGLCAKC